MNAEMSKITLDMVRNVLQEHPELLQKSWTQATGLVWYDLEAPAKIIYPVITPLRNMIARVDGKGSTATHWKAITGVNITGVRAGVSEGNRNATIATQLKNYTAPYKGWGLEDNVTFEADYASAGFDDAKARAVEGLLRSVMIAEEAMIVGANTSLSLGTTGTPQLASSVTGGAIPLSTVVKVYCFALTAEGYRFASIIGGVTVTGTRTNADGSTDTIYGGYAAKSVQATITTNAGSSANSITAYVAPTTGALAYAWYWGPNAAETIGAITTINSVTITTSAGAGTQKAADLGATVSDKDPLLFDGLLYFILGAGQEDNASASGAYVAVQPTGVAGTGTPLTPDGAGGVVEIETALKDRWDNYRLSPELMLVNSQELVNISRAVMTGGAAPLFRFNLDSGNSAGVNNLTVTAGSVVGNYLNKYTMSGGSLVKVMLHPNVPPGTIIFYTKTLPYPLSNVSNLLDMKMRRDYYQIEWVLKSRKFEYGIYADGVLRCFFPPAFGCITNIANG
jgi:hypothetical protein